MVDPGLAETSMGLFTVALAVYLAATVLAFVQLGLTRVDAGGAVVASGTGRRAGHAAIALTVGGTAVHTASVVTRGLAAGRVPWTNMYEYSSLLALLAVVVGLVVVTRRFGYGHLMGFVLTAAALLMASALLVHVDAAPAQPALRTQWLKVHTTAAILASAVFTVGFAAAGLYLVRDTAERRAGGGAGGAAGDAAGGEPRLRRPPRGSTVGALDAPREAAASPAAQRAALSRTWFAALPGALAAAFTLAVWQAPLPALAAGAAAALLGALTWYAAPALPAAGALDDLAHRTITFGFVVWTFAVIAGAIWAEQAWGRYWGWDPKETAALVTWLLYASYLHARSTRGWRGRPAAWLAVAAYAALLITYFVVNLWVVGLHSYAT